MRKFLIPILLAGTLMPATAMAQDRVDGPRSRAERSEGDDSSDSRPQRAQRSQSENRAERPTRVERVERVDGTERQPRIERQVERTEPVRQVRRIERTEPVQQVRQVEQVAPVQQVQQVQRTERTGNAVIDGLRAQARRDQAGGGDRDHDGRDWSHNDKDNHWDKDHHWSGDWRKDRRYDWSHYRSRYGSLYRLGRYYDPYGWGYRRWSVGYNIWPSYYGSNFWLDDPWMYRLPPAYGPYRWVRYYDDALLVNIYTGMVVDVVHNFFW